MAVGARVRAHFYVTRMHGKGPLGWLVFFWGPPQNGGVPFGFSSKCLFLKMDLGFLGPPQNCGVPLELLVSL